MEAALRTFGPQVLDLSIAYALAFIIGWNREHEARGAGLRTFPLVAVASCGFMQAAESIPGQDAEATARIMAGVITGIGFVGAGAILKGDAQVHGAATAASTGATGATGAAVALGSYHIAVVVCAFTAATLYFLTPLKAPRHEDRPDSPDR
jgi:putative Mg2+ transporter-C (MgtC) family protein